MDNTTPRSHSPLKAPKLSVKTWSDDINLLVGLTGLTKDILLSFIRSLIDINGLLHMCTGVSKSAVTSTFYNTRYATKGNS